MNYFFSKCHSFRDSSHFFLASPEGYAALAKMREKAGDAVGSEAALKKCEGMTKTASTCHFAIAGATASFVRYAGGKWEVRPFARCDTPLTVGKAVLGDTLYAAGHGKLVVWELKAA